MEFWNQKTFCLVTGASRGIGQTIVTEFSKKVAPGSVFLILARSEAALEETKKSALRAAEPNQIQVVTAAVDLAKPNSKIYLDLIQSTLTSTGSKARDFDHALLVHNAASPGNITLSVAQMEDIEPLQEYFDCNIVSMILLTSQFVKVFSDESKQRSIVQITSIAATVPFSKMSLYCAGKAARDMLMQNLALENPSISVISYAPGPVDTELYDYAINNLPEAESQWFIDTKKSEEFMTPLQTVEKLIRVLGQKKYTKGEHVDHSEIE